MLSVEQAQARVLDAVEKPAGTETIALAAAVGRVLAEPIVAARALPPWDNSAMDGFAVRAADCVQGAALSVVGTIAAGHPATRALEPGQALRIMTGAPMPDGADAVVMREYAHMHEGTEPRVAFERMPKPGDHIRRKGSDVQPDEAVLPTGSVVGAAEVGLLAALGITHVPAYRRPTVAIVSTGDELVELGQEPGPGQIINSNAHALAVLVTAAGGMPQLHPITRDDPDALRARFAAARSADILVSIGGVSVGEYDYVKEAMAAAGLALDFWRVAMQPGKPIAFGCAEQTLAFGLPGNPASSMVSFELFVGPALRKLAGRTSGWLRPRALVRLREPVTKNPGRRLYLRARLERDADGQTLWAHPNPRQGSGMLRSMVGINALLEIAEEATAIEPGTYVPALLLETI